MLLMSEESIYIFSRALIQKSRIQNSCCFQSILRHSGGSQMLIMGLYVLWMAGDTVIKVKFGNLMVTCIDLCWMAAAPQDAHSVWKCLLFFTLKTSSVTKFTPLHNVAHGLEFVGAKDKNTWKQLGNSHTRFRFSLPVYILLWLEQN